jgi:hypothetical protein
LFQFEYDIADTTLFSGSVSENYQPKLLSSFYNKLRITIAI